MFAGLKKSVLKLAPQLAQELTCPKCKHRFKPFAAGPPETFAELTHSIPCPQCGHAFSFNDGAQALADTQANPPGPFAKPAESRIELTGDSGEWVYQIPRGHTPGGLIFFAVLWNAISWSLGLGAFAGKVQTGVRSSLGGLIFAAVFPGIGLGLIYLVLRLGFARYRLILGPRTVRLRRKVILAKDYELPTDEITSVRKKQFYSQNYQPVYGIEIAAGSRRIRFGSSLTEDEKNWLCWQIREFVRQHGAVVES
jgi:hypothetical protein